MHRTRWGAFGRTHTLAAALAAFTMLAATSCATPAENLKYAHLGMSPNDLETNIGKPNMVRGSVVNRFGQQVEVWQYDLIFPDNPDARTFKIAFTALTVGVGSPVWLAQNTKTYWFYFVDSKLARWNEAGDWESEKERLYELPWRLLGPEGPG